MDQDIVYFQNYEEMLLRLTDVFKDASPNALRDLLFFLKEFSVEHIIPEETIFYATDIAVEGLEITPKEKVSEILVGGIEKYRAVGQQMSSIPPVAVLRSTVRSFVIHGLAHAIEAFVRNLPLYGVVIELEDIDIFEYFKMDEQRSAFLTPLVQQYLKKTP